MGDRGTIRLRDGRLEMIDDRPEQVQVDLPADYKASYRNAIAHFLDGLEHGTPFETAPEDNLKTLRLVEAVYADSAVHLRGR